MIPNIPIPALIPLSGAPITSVRSQQAADGKVSDSDDGGDDKNGHGDEVPKGVPESVPSEERVFSEGVMWVSCTSTSGKVKISSPTQPST